MARIRSIHPGIWTDEAFVSVSRDARLLFIGILNECDDQGAFEWKPLQIKMRLTAGDDASVATISAWLSELASANLMMKYEIGGASFGAVRNFREWQRPKKPNSTHPMSPELRTYTGPKGKSSERIDDDAEQITEQQPDHPATVPNQLPTDGEKPPQMESSKEGSKESSSLRSDDPPADAKPKRTSQKPKSQIKPDWQPGHDGHVYAEQRGVNVFQELPSFRNHHQAKGSLMADWDAAWRTWCDNQVKWGRAPGKPVAPDPGLFASAPPVADDPSGIKAYIAKFETAPVLMQSGDRVPGIGGWGVESIADEILLTVSRAGAEAVAKPNWHPLAEWLRDDLPADWNRFLGTIKRVASSIDGPIRSMQLFDAALRAERVAA